AEIYVFGGCNGSGKTTLADYWIIYDNSRRQRNVVAEKTPSRQITVYQPLIWQQIAQESL
ncbi:MAG: hypothetical protein AB4372_17465, partial [Xenococcus sp. (in: cyanobacteria)]